jgi:hypothetical protein
MIIKCILKDKNKFKNPKFEETELHQKQSEVAGMLELSDQQCKLSMIDMPRVKMEKEDSTQ